jgi:hypothetical protein
MATRLKVSEWIRDEINQVKLKGWIRCGLSNDQLADNIGIDRSTFYRWKNDNKDFRDILKEDREYVLGSVVNVLYQKALEGDMNAIKFILTNRQRKEWREKQEVELSGEVGIVDAMIRKANERKERLENDS